MNDYYYYTLIREFIPKKERAICSRTDRHYIILKYNERLLLNAYIYLHMGSPCGRYCICRYFDKDDILELYNN